MKKTVLMLRQPPRSSTEILDHAGEVGSAERKRAGEELAAQLTLRRMKVQELFEEIQNDRLLFGTPKHLRMFSIVLEASSADLQAFLERLPEHYPELTWKKEVDPKKPSGVDHSPDRRRKTA